MQFGSAAFDRVTDEQVLQEEMGSEYMHKVLPNTRVPVAAFTSVAKTASDSEGLTLIDPPHPTPTLIVDTDESRQEDQMFGPAEMRNQKITVAAFREESSYALSPAATRKVHDASPDKTIQYVFGEPLGRIEDSILSEEYTPEVMLKIEEPSMTPDVRRTPRDSPKRQQMTDKHF